LEAGVRGEVMAGGDDVPGAHETQAVAGHGDSFWLAGWNSGRF
jgi:hypothetical protein